MSTKIIETAYGDKVSVLDDYGSPIALLVESGEGESIHLNIGVEEARKIARALDAFAEIHTV